MLSTCNRAEIYAVAESATRRRRDRRGSSASITSWISRSRCRRAPLRAAAAPTPRATCSASPPASTRWSSASRRSSARSRRPTRAPATAVHRAAAQPAVPLRVHRRQARAHGNRPRRRRGVGQLRGDRAGPEDLRRPGRPQRADPRRRRDGEAHRASTCRRSRSGRSTIASRTLAAAEELAARLDGDGRPVDASSTTRSPRPTSSSLPPAPPSRS